MNQMCLVTGGCVNGESMFKEGNATPDTVVLHSQELTLLAADGCTMLPLSSQKWDLGWQFDIVVVVSSIPTNLFALNLY